MLRTSAPLIGTLGVKENKVPNWFEESPTRSVIAHTILVAATTWGVSTFILEDNRLEDYKAQVETERSRGSAMQARIDSLESESDTLRSENREYLWLLVRSPESKALAAEQIAKINGEKAKLQEELKAERAANGKSGVRTEVRKVRKDNAFVEDTTNLIFSVLEISIEKEARVTVSMPDGSRQENITASAGSKWDFHFDKQQYRIVVTEVNYVEGFVAIRFMSLGRDA